MADFILRNGEVIDGSGGHVSAPMWRSPAIGLPPSAMSAGATGAREIDVAGKIVAPGLSTRYHTHDDRALLATPEMAIKQARGSPPSSPAIVGSALPRLLREGATAAPRPDRRCGTTTRMPRFADYLAALESKAPAAINAACLVGHSTLRVGAMDSLERSGAWRTRSRQ